MSLQMITKVSSSKSSIYTTLRPFLTSLITSESTEAHLIMHTHMTYDSAITKHKQQASTTLISIENRFMIWIEILF
uniref:Uncharacterized protein n=1 Tax=Populus trichocarpa TaxID=3694 RepID=A0A2K1YL59_POPTR